MENEVTSMLWRKTSGDYFPPIPLLGFSRYSKKHYIPFFPEFRQCARLMIETFVRARFWRIRKWTNCARNNTFDEMVELMCFGIADDLPEFLNDFVESIAYHVHVSRFNISALYCHREKNLAFIRGSTTSYHNLALELCCSPHPELFLKNMYLSWNIDKDDMMDAINSLTFDEHRHPFRRSTTLGEILHRVKIAGLN